MPAEELAVRKAAVLSDRRGSWLTDALAAFCCAKDQTPLSQETLSDWVIWSVTQPPSNPEPSYPNSTGKQGEEIEFPPQKTDLQIPINRSLESLHSIKFPLPRWSGQSGSSFYAVRMSTHVNMSGCMRGENKRSTHALKVTNAIASTTRNISAIKQIQTKGAEVCPSS